MKKLKPETIRHKTVSVKVNADIDEGMAQLVALFNTHPFIRTCASCEGYPRADGNEIRDAYLYFDLSEPRKPHNSGFATLADFCFGKVEPAIRKIYEAAIQVEGRQGNFMAKLYFPHESIGQIVKLLTPVIGKANGR